MPFASAVSLAPVNLTMAGLNPATNLVAANGTNGNRVAVDSLTWVRIVNGGAGAITVTIETPNTVYGLVVSDHTVAVPAGQERWIFLGPGQREDTFKQPGTSEVWIQFSGVTTVTVGAYRLSRDMA